MAAATMTQEEILSSTKTVAQGLEALKEEHETIKSTLLAAKDSMSSDERLLMEEKSSIIDKNLDHIRLGIEEAQVMMALASHWQFHEAEKRKLRAQLKLYCQENAWLREELKTANDKVQKLNQEVAQLEEDKKHLEFMNSMKKFDDDESMETKEASMPRSETQNTLQELGFGPEEEEDIQANLHPTPANAMAASASGGYEIPQRIKTLHTMIIQYASSAQYGVAVPLCKQALEDLEATNGREHPDFATMLTILALVYRDMKKTKEAVELFNEALAIREKVFGPDDPLVATTLNNLALLYGKRGKFKEAEPHCKRALAIREKNLGPEHPDVAKQLNNLAHLYHNMGEFGKVEECYARSLAIYEGKFGPDDISAVKTKNYMVPAMLKQGKVRQAEELCKEILNRAHLRAFGAVSTECSSIWQVAEECEQKKLDPAAINESNQWQKAISGENSQAILMTMKHLANIYRKQGKYQAAETLDDAVLRAKKQPNQSLPPTLDSGMDASMSVSSVSPDAMSQSQLGGMTNSPSNSGLRSRLLNVFGLQSGTQ